MSRNPQEQMLLVDRLGLVRAAYFAAKQTQPDALENAASAALAALHGVTMGDNGLSQLAGRQSRRPRPAGRAGRWLRASRPAAAAGPRLGLSAPFRARHDHRRRRGAAAAARRMAAKGCASTLAMEMSDGAQRLVVNCGGPGLVPTRLPHELVLGAPLDRRPFHVGARRYQFHRDPPRWQARQGRDRRCRSSAARTMTVRGSRPATTAMSKGFGLFHQRRLSLGNDGKEVRGEDRLIAKGRKKIREAAPFAIRFHLAPGVEATMTADGMGAILRSSGRRRGISVAEGRCFRSRKACSSTAAARWCQRCNWWWSGKYPLLAAKSPGSSAAQARS